MANPLPGPLAQLLIPLSSTSTLLPHLLSFLHPSHLCTTRYPFWLPIRVVKETYEPRLLLYLRYRGFVFVKIVSETQ